MTQRNPKKICFETPDLKLELTSKINLDIKHHIFFLEKAKELIEHINDFEVQQSIENVPVKMKPKMDSNTDKRHLNLLKERLPNPVMKNGILIEPSDVKTLETYESGYCCPNCGQQKAIILEITKENQYIFMKSKDGISYDFIEEWYGDHSEGIPDSCFLAQPDKQLTQKDYQDFIASIDELPIKPNNVTVNVEETVGHCPFCRSVYSLDSWQQTFDNPENFFEYRDICKDCGGEIETINKGKKGKKFYTVLHCVRCGKEYENNESTSKS